jgi:acyl-[acyl-carrier-protein] desaturase
MRHHHAYSEFVSAIFKIQWNDDCFSIHDEKLCEIVMFSERIRRKITIRTVFRFSTRIGVYSRLYWYHAKNDDEMEIDKITGLTDEAEKARDYLMKLPARMTFKNDNSSRVSIF